MALLTSTLAFARTICLPLVGEWLLEPSEMQTRTTAGQRTAATKMILACVLRSPLSNECAISETDQRQRDKGCSTEGDAQSGKGNYFEAELQHGNIPLRNAATLKGDFMMCNSDRGLT